MLKRFVIVGFALIFSARAMAQTNLNGGGATFPYPIYSKWFSEYKNQHPDVQINYQSIGSGGGIKQLQAGTVDFGASDGPMTDEQLAATPFKVQHFPTVLGSVVPAYNVPGVNADLRFTPDVLADIFLGRITSWNDARLAKLNPDAKLPNTSIIVVHRSDGSGTTYIFTDYLSKVSNDWKAGVGKSTSVKWPVGLGAKGNEGVAGMVRQMEGAIGYVELIYALQNNITYGAVKNPAGEFIKASLGSTSKAAEGVKMPADYRISITNSPTKGAYPISSFTWLLVPVQSKDARKGQVLKDFLNWMMHEGQKYTNQLSYGSLPDSVVKAEEQTLKTIK